jgi:hypothetical protein
MNNSEYTIPKDYFAKKKTALKEIPFPAPQHKTIRLWWQKLAVAASIALLLYTSIYYWNLSENKGSKFNTISAAALNEFLENSPYSYYPESYLLEVDDIELQELEIESPFDEEEVYLYLNQYNNAIL